MGAQSSTTLGRLLEKDLQLYERKSKEYRIRTLADIRSKLPPGTKKFTLTHLPDPLQFWNLQVSNIVIIEFSLSVNMTCIYFRLNLRSTPPNSPRSARTFSASL